MNNAGTHIQVLDPTTGAANAAVDFGGIEGLDGPRTL